ncbi:MAG: alpha-2-macroglobulin family protein, partial [Limisphaerales bacterium]
RQVRTPWWWGWGGRGGHPLRDATQEIGNGTLRTGVDGSFEIRFTAAPDTSVPETDEPTFEFAVHADVTDGAGETRSADRTLRLGYAALEARVKASEWLTVEQPVQLEIHTTTLDGEPQLAEGSLTIHALQPPSRVHRGNLPTSSPRGRFGLREMPDPDDEPGSADLSDPNHWPLGAVVLERGFTTGTNGLTTVDVRLPAGAYRVSLATQDRFGRPVTCRLPLEVIDPAATRSALQVPHWLEAPKWEVQPGEDFLAIWGTGYDAGRAFVEIEHRDRLIARYWTRPGTTQTPIRQTVTEALRGGFTLAITFVRENRAYLTVRPVSVPWRNQELDLRWERFTSKLQPGQAETWTAVISGPQAEKAAAEMVATLYDASLDTFVPHQWPTGFDVFRHDHSQINTVFANQMRPLQTYHQSWRLDLTHPDLRYRELPADLRHAGRQNQVMARMMAAPMSASTGARTGLIAPGADAFGGVMMFKSERGEGVAELAMAADSLASAAPSAGGGGIPGPGPSAPDLSQVSARKNLNETAFFFPHVLSDSNGVARLQFTLPEALTEWRFLGFAHDPRLRAGLLTGKAVTSKDLMVQPNPPRFLREGDTVEFTVKVSNQSDQPQRGKVRLTLADGFDDSPVDARLGNRVPEQEFDIPARESRTHAWRLNVPDGLALLTYKAVGATDRLSDGEEGFLPVLARRILVTESLPLPIRGPATRQFTFQSLLDSGTSKTLQHQSLTVQMVSQPAWYAVLALPYLMEFPYECSEQTFNRYYANTLARFIANSDPQIRRVFELWKNTPALDSPLEKNPDLKSVMLEESPWLQQAQNESRSRRNVGILFDDHRLGSEMGRALQQLREARLPDGGWSWFPGGPRNEYITLYLVTGFGRLRHLGADVPIDLAVESLAPVDVWMAGHHARILKDWKTPEDYVPRPADALYLYGRSFFLKDTPIATEHQPAVDFFLARARQHWLKTGHRQTEGHLAIALKRFGDADTAQAIVKSLKERSVTNEELGRF